MNSVMRGVVLGISLLGLGVAQAADDKGQFGIKGVGGMSCESYLKSFEAKDSRYVMYLGWFGGYITATNQYLPKTFDLAPWQNMNLVSMAVANVCRQETKASVLLALQRVLQGIYPLRLEQASPMVEVKGEKVTLRIYQEVLRRTQEKLKNLGFYTGKADGKFGPGTKKALEAFQKKRGLAVTGLPDQATLLALMSTPVKKP